MIFVPKKNIWTPPRKWGQPKYQKGVLHPVGFWAEAGASGTVTLSGELVDVSPNWEDYAGIYVRTDGTVDKREGSSYTQIDTSTDWIIPNGSASSLYEVYCTITADVGGYNGFDSSSATDTWLAMSADRHWKVVAQGPYGADSKDITFTLSIRYDGGSTLDSASYHVISAGDV